MNRAADTIRSMATYMLAFDHRDSLMTAFFETAEPGKAEVASARSLKTLIADGLLAAIGRSRVDRKDAGALVDATYGGIAIDKLRTRGVRFAVPVEASGMREFEFEHVDWRQRLDAIRPTWAKVLVRYNPTGDAEMNARQGHRLQELQAGAKELGVGFLFELLVPPEPDQRGPDFDTATRPGLAVQAISELHTAGIAPDLWKVEGFERRADCEAVADVAGAPCVVLGRGADAAAVERWLRAAAGVFDGFAIGRSIWWEACQAFVAGSMERDAAVSAIADRYGHFVDVYRSTV
jgi:myo-inositol catabolism protein IolC